MAHMCLSVHAAKIYLAYLFRVMYAVYGHVPTDLSHAKSAVYLRMCACELMH